jgi:hypothetical protein
MWDSDPPHTPMSELAEPIDALTLLHKHSPNGA